MIFIGYEEDSDPGFHGLQKRFWRKIYVRTCWIYRKGPDAVSGLKELSFQRGRKKK